MPAPELVLEALSKAFVSARRIEALRSCSLRAAGGECVAILGASGCGKTTLLRTVAGLERPDGGRVLFGTRDVTNVAVERRNVGFVFQYDALFPRSSAYDNVAFGLRTPGASARAIDARVRSVAARVHASGLLERSAKTLSGGEKQRVALARALAPEPDVLLLDEPLSRLDTALRLELRRELAEVVRSRVATMLYVTHDQGDALALGDRIAVMRDGAIAQIGTARELFDRPVNAFVASAVGSPAIAFAPASLAFSDAREDERCGLRATAVRITDAGTVPAVVSGVEDFVDVAYAYVSGTFGTLVTRLEDGVRARPGDRVVLAIDCSQALRFAADGTRVERSPHA